MAPPTRRSERWRLRRGLFRRPRPRKQRSPLRRALTWAALITLVASTSYFATRDPAPRPPAPVDRR